MGSSDWLSFNLKFNGCHWIRKMVSKYIRLTVYIIGYINMNKVLREKKSSGDFKYINEWYNSIDVYFYLKYKVLSSRVGLTADLRSWTALPLTIFSLGPVPHPITSSNVESRILLEDHPSYIKDWIGL